MTDQQPLADCVDFPCPRCGENRVDSMVWLDDETVQCASCGHMYRPGRWEQDEQQEQ